MIFLLLLVVVVGIVLLALYGAWRDYIRSGGAEARRHYVYVDAAWDADGRLSDDPLSRRALAPSAAGATLSQHTSTERRSMTDQLSAAPTTADAYAQTLVEHLDEVMNSDVRPRSEFLGEILAAFEEADALWGMTYNHPSGTLIFQWAEGQTPDVLAAAAAVLKRVGVTTRINGQWLNLTVFDDYYGPAAENAETFWQHAE